MTNTELPTDAATQKLIDEAMLLPASLTNPQVIDLPMGVEDFSDATEVHAIASGWQVGTAEALCGADLRNDAHGLVHSLPLCWLCDDLLRSRS